MIIPKFLYKGFSKKKYAIEFIENGKFQLGLIQYYRKTEDDSRRDESEGKSESIVKNYWPDLDLRLIGTYGNPLYLFCTSGPNVDLNHMKNRWPYIVKINDPGELKNTLCELKPNNTKMEAMGCMIKKVSYTKGEPINIDPNSFEAVNLTYTQKPRSYWKECEFRYIVTTLPPSNRTPDTFLKYNIGKRIDYALFI